MIAKTLLDSNHISLLQRYHYELSLFEIPPPSRATHLIKLGASCKIVSDPLGLENGREANRKWGSNREEEEEMIFMAKTAEMMTFLVFHPSERSMDSKDTLIARK